MKRYFLYICLAIVPFLAKAQCYDCAKDDSEWKFAAGVALYSKNYYASGYRLERQPFEFKFKYKIKDHHILHLGFPLSYKVNYSGPPQVILPNYQMDESMENKAQAYWDALKHDDIYADYYKTNKNYYNLFGVSLGYDYNFTIFDNFSLFAGIDLAFNYYKNYAEYFRIGYDLLDDDNTSELRFLDYTERVNNIYMYFAQVQAGVRYQFQKLLFEASAGYVITHNREYGKLDSMFYNRSTNSVSDVWRRRNFKHFAYQISLYYTF